MSNSREMDYSEELSESEDRLLILPLLNYNRLIWSALLRGQGNSWWSIP
jgi:hypothetical protein